MRGSCPTAHRATGKDEPQAKSLTNTTVQMTKWASEVGGNETRRDDRGGHERRNERKEKIRGGGEEMRRREKHNKRRLDEWRGEEIGQEMTEGIARGQGES